MLGNKQKINKPIRSPKMDIGTYDRCILVSMWILVPIRGSYCWWYLILKKTNIVCFIYTTSKQYINTNHIYIYMYVYICCSFVIILRYLAFYQYRFLPPAITRPTFFCPRHRITTIDYCKLTQYTARTHVNFHLYVRPY